MVVGATARDLLIRYALGTRPRRETDDIDVAIAVASWREVSTLTQGLPLAGTEAHKFSVKGTDVDIIPFGTIESVDRTILWPDDHEMNVFGFTEAMTDAVQVKLGPDLTVAVASLAAQSVLKTVAWRDRRHQTTRDAIDLRTILDAYSTGHYVEELYDGYPDLLKKYDFDPPQAGAERLGQEAATLLTADGRKVVTELLDNEMLFRGLTADMRGLSVADNAIMTAYAAGFRSVGMTTEPNIAGQVASSHD